MPDITEFYFGFVSKGTVCEGARLEQELIPARLRCAACDSEWEIALPVFGVPGVRACRSCGGCVQHEFEVESIEVEEAECIAPR